MLAGASIVSALNYLFYPILGRMLQASQLGEVQVLISIITQIMFVLSIGRMVILNVLTNETSPKVQQSFMTEAEKALSRTAIVLSIVIIAAIPLLKRFLQINSYAALLLLVPVVLVSSTRISRDAYMRAHSLFKQAVIADIIVSVLRILSAVIFIALGFGTQGALGGLIVGILVSAYYCHKVTAKYGLRLPLYKYLLPQHLKDPINTKLIRPHIRYAAVVACVGILQALIVVMDSVSAKHFFTPSQAGLYAGISIVGNIVLFITGSINGVLVASVRSTIDHSYNIRKLAVSMGILVFVGSFVAAVFSLAPSFFVTILLGSRYTVYAYLLPKVSLTMLLLSIANLIFSYHIALRDLQIIFAALVSIIIMVTGVALHHQTLDQMVNAILLASTLLLAVNIIRTVWWNMRALRRQSA